jgi:hypothetical protein
LTSGTGGPATSVVTASITPTGNRLQIAAVKTTSTVPTIDTANGLTWVQISTTSSAGGVLTLFRAMAASPSAGAHTIRSGSSVSFRWWISEYSGVSTDGTNGSAAIGSVITGTTAAATSLTISPGFGSFGITSAGVSAFQIGAAPTGTGFAARASWTQTVTSSSLQGQFFAGQDTTASASWDAGQTIDACGIGVELLTPAPTMAWIQSVAIPPALMVSPTNRSQGARSYTRQVFVPPFPVRYIPHPAIHLRRRVIIT